MGDGSVVADDAEGRSAPDLVTVQEAADLLQCHPETIRRMARRGEIKAFRLGTVGLRIEKASLYRPAFKE